MSVIVLNRIVQLGCLMLVASCGDGNRAQAADDVAVSEVAKQCAACHQGALALSKFTTDELAAKIVSKKAKPEGHPPVNVDDKAINALAKELAEKP